MARSRTNIPWGRPLRAAVLSVVLMTIALFVLMQLWMFCEILWYARVNPSSSAVMRDTMHQLREKDPQLALHVTWVDYDQISNNLKTAVVASEDANFMHNDGVEWDAIQQAWKFNEKQDAEDTGDMRGGSTITQQLAKNLLLTTQRTYLRKGQELILTFMINAAMSKRRILELYLNIAEWGTGVFGAQAASEHYFRHEAATLTPAQATQLAAMLPNPRYYDEHGVTAYLRSRMYTLERRMHMVEVPR